MKWDGFSEKPLKGPRVGAWAGPLKNPTKCIWRWKPDRRSNFFSPPSHLCGVKYITEISLNVTFNQSRSFSLILLYMPVSSATAKTSFSAMRRLKTYLRSTISLIGCRHLLCFMFIATGLVIWANIYTKHAYFHVYRHRAILSVLPRLGPSMAQCWVELNWLFNVSINDISVIYVTAHRCAGRLKKKLDLRSGSHAIDIS